ncbi:hypothetical protein AHMF7605_22750 [Adhaeribacter arboris]|uniref:Heparan-alpha-glucosaminide N-acetyltransferase catalytic domain-containing protein n=1 Tax=Adhaeribacter arboris TaxID=2072846 RepID=A0A2T2YKU3_9BACT|nr:heparan-alpha-glucosaminide N-acetyltransferase domain-containing protein [Adhaeribacter arboris]PSR56121.1 hypothetical protein AHMF7605_22750 [Adhaeribacter arboris]
MQRINAIDFTRGLVMIIMALDHTRDLLHISSLTQSPTDLSTTTPALFFTRWITHLCAPIFVFLSGTSAYLSLQRTGNVTEARKFLLRRGIWLIILEFTIISFGIWFDLKFRTFFFQVIAAIGFSFIVLALLLKLPARVIGLIGLLIVFGHNLVSILPLGAATPLSRVALTLFNPNIFQITPQLTFFVGYPPIPWLGIMLIGFSVGPLFTLPVAQRKSFFWRTGLATVVFFICLRFSNIYGDPAAWSMQNAGLFTFLSFLNTTKYPPSLLYTCMTLGIMFLIFWLVDGFKNKLVQIISTYGKVPLFYYIIHWYLLHLILLAMVFLQGFHWDDLQFGTFLFGRPKQPSGVNLAVIYFIWLSVVVALYPLCHWYQRYRSNHPEKTWLRYL